MHYTDAQPFSRAVLDIARGIDPTLPAELMPGAPAAWTFVQNDYLGVLGVATTLVKALGLLPGVTPRPGQQPGLAFEGPAGEALQVEIHPAHARLVLEPR